MTRLAALREALRPLALCVVTLACSSAEPSSPTASGGEMAQAGGGSPATAGAAAGGGVAGSSAGGATSGGSATGGDGSGGSVTGGAATGGSAAAGAATGGAATGGATTGGAGPTSPLDGAACVEGSGRKLYVSPAGSAQGDGKSFATAYDLATAGAAAMPGDTLLLMPGKYAVPYVAGAKNTITLSQRGTAEQPIRIIAQGGRAEVDFSFPEQAWVQDSYGFLVSGSYWSMCRLDITRAGYQGVYVTGQHNTFENCTFHDNRNTGLEINKGGAHTTVINCDAYRNYDPKKFGGMADGFGPKETQGPGNRFYGCRAWENSDDGYDAYNSPQTVIFERSFAFRNGIDVWGYPDYAGNGNGFKVGGLAQQANHRLTQCAAFANRVKGFDQNNNTGGLTIYNSTAFDNGTNFGLGGALNAGQKHDLRNNISLGSTNTISNAVEQNNSWTLGLAVTAADFKDLDAMQGRAPRAADGSLPDIDFLKLAPGSKLIDAGVDVGLPFEGTAPDLGAVESP
jgi:hypothetical protein